MACSSYSPRENAVQTATLIFDGCDRSQYVCKVGQAGVFQSIGDRGLYETQFVSRVVMRSWKGRRKRGALCTQQKRIGKLQFTGNPGRVRSIQGRLRFKNDLPKMP